MLLSDVDIRRHLEVTGAIVIDPFSASRLQSASYDLTLGPFFWRPNDLPDTVLHLRRELPSYALEDARRLGEIFLRPGERVLGHSMEFIGGTVGYRRPESPAEASRSYGSGLAGRVPVAVTTHLQATSTAARIGITACDDAGWGDVGYLNRWTFELTNRGVCACFLPVGAIIAQLAFEEVTPPDDRYGVGHRYQAFADLKRLKAAWRPEDMLPRPLKVHPLEETCAYPDP
jgi:dCTP deaminase